MERYLAVVSFDIGDENVDRERIYKELLERFSLDHAYFLLDDPSQCPYKLPNTTVFGFINVVRTKAKANVYASASIMSALSSTTFLSSGSQPYSLNINEGQRDYALAFLNEIKEKVFSHCEKYKIFVSVGNTAASFCHNFDSKSHTPVNIIDVN